MEQLEELVVRFQDGDQAALAEIYERTSRYVYFTCIGFVKNEQDAADISQEVYLTVMQQIDTLEDTAKFLPWLNRITVNKCRNYLAKKTPVLMEEDTLEECLPETEEAFLPEEYVESKEKREIVLQIMRSSLSDVLYQTILLYYFNEMTVPEIAEAMDCPAGTVTYRLSAARAKIKEGVLHYEEKHDEKLYGLTAVLFFGRLFTAEAAELAVPGLPESILGAGSTEAVVAEAAKEGVKGMLKTLKAKCIAGLLALAVVGGGITAAVVVSSSNDKEVVQEDDRNKTQDDKNVKEPDKQPDDKQPDDKQPDDKQPDSEKDKEDGDVSGPTVTPAVSAEKDYKSMAEQIDAAAISYLEAMKAGDIETILSLTDPEDWLYEKLSGIKEYETGKEFIRTVSSNLRYEAVEEGSTEYRLKDELERGKNEFFLKQYLALPHTVLFREMLTVPGVVFEEGEHIPEGYKVESAEEAMRIVRTVMEKIPLNSSNISVSLQEDGTFYFSITGAFSMIDSTKFGSDETFLEDFLSEFIYGGTTVGASDRVFKGQQEEWEQLLSLLKSGDFTGLYELASGEPEIYGRAHKSPEGLTEEQRAFLDSYIEQIEVYISDITWDKTKSYSTTVMVVSPALSLDKEEMAWLTENGVKEDDIAWRIGGEDKRDLQRAMERFLAFWDDAISHAEYRIK